MAQVESRNPEYHAVREKWRRANLSPLWESATAHKLADGPEKALIWRWDEVRPLLDDALSLADPAAVERRVLTLTNPNLQNPGATLETICVALQSLLPGEKARPHRHSMNAIRLLLEGSGAETIVDGKVCPMEYGDLVLTPGWTWHEHQHAGQKPVIWLDALDVPLHDFLGTSEFQPGPVNSKPETFADAAFAYAGLVPEGIHPSDRYSPVFRYRYDAASAAVAAAPRSPDGSRRIKYVNPLTGSPAMALLDCGLVQIDRDAPTAGFKTNAHSVYCVMEGSGSSLVGMDRIAWKEKDIIAVPPGNAVSHLAASEKAVLFTLSDRDLLARVGLLKEGFQAAE